MKDYIKKHIKLLKPSATLAINEKAKKLNNEGKKTFNFGFGQSPFPVPNSIVSALKNNANKRIFASARIKKLKGSNFQVSK